MAVGEWDQRQLCPDGACIGVIGPDGTCKVCGRAAPNWGDERNRGLIDPPDEDEDDEDEEGDEDLAADGDDEDDEEEDDEDDEDDDDDDSDDEDDDDDDSDDEEADQVSKPGVATARRGEWAARQLCPDGGCIGVIGPDGRCNMCGRSASKDPAAAAAPPAAQPASSSSKPDPDVLEVTTDPVNIPDILPVLTVRTHVV
ncbi:MAG TPA: hypothetical protein VF516_46125, partial [Kofleriaceae bacterium]